MLAKTYRLTKRGSFTYIYNKGERKGTPLISIVFVKSKNLKIGFSVPNKVGKACVRNKVKRRLRAALREFIPKILPCQVVFTAKLGTENLSFLEIKSTVKNLLIRSKLLV